jgi:hypothetical protein
MPNIPLIQQNRVSSSPQPRRANKVMESEVPTDNTPTIKRRLERRHSKDRRQKQRPVSINRRQARTQRRISDSQQHVAAQSKDLSNNVGKHINTTA